MDGGWSRMDLGVGLVVVPGADRLWVGVEDLVDVVEVEPQTFWERRDGGWAMHEGSYRWLEQLRLPVICHSVSFPVGGAVPPDPEGLDLTVASVERLGARHWSEHLSFNRVRVASGEEAGDVEACFLLPPVPTWSTVEAAAQAIGECTARSPLPFLVETPVNYLRPVAGDLDDGQFVAEVTERADCGILLDLHNIWANERNGRQSVEEFVAQIPCERVLEVHLAGGDLYGGFYLDGHSGAVAPELLELARAVLPRLANLRAVVFEAMPDALARMGVAGLRRTLEDIHRLVDRAAPAHPAAARAAAAEIPVHHDGGSQRSSAERERDLVAFTTRRPGARTTDPGAVLLRDLTDRARLSLVAADRPGEVEQLRARYGSEVAAAVGQAFVAEHPARLLEGDAGEDFARWWRPVAHALAREPAGCINRTTWGSEESTVARGGRNHDQESP